MSSVLPLVFNPDPRLRALSAEIPEKDIPGLLDLAESMVKTMIADEGVGLAAPQIGQNIRLIIVLTKDGPEIMFNPKITKTSLRSVWGEEGCLSIPKTFGQVKRKKNVRCEYIDIKGQKRVVDAADMVARIIQHEVDHLDGILFIDKAKDIHTEE